MSLILANDLSSQTPVELPGAARGAKQQWEAQGDTIIIHVGYERGAQSEV